MKRVLVTGATGFVGANVARRLLRDGQETHLLVRPEYQRWRLAEIAGEVRLHETNLEDREGVRRAVREVKPDWVFHLAAYGAYSSQRGIDRMTATNLTGSAALLDACVEEGVEAFVQTGSSSEYGYKDHAAAEEEKIEPNSHYAITKSAATHYCQFTARQHDVHAVTVRLYSVYGPYEEPTRLIPTLLVRSMEGQLPPLASPGTAHDFVYVEEAVEAMIRVSCRVSLERGSVLNICSGVQSTLRTVVESVRRIAGIAAEPVWSTMQQRSWDTNVWVGSPRAMEHATGWRATTDIDAGLTKTLAWFREKQDRLQFYARRIEAAPPG